MPEKYIEAQQTLGDLREKHTQAIGGTRAQYEPSAWGQNCVPLGMPAAAWNRYRIWTPSTSLTSI